MALLIDSCFLSVVPLLSRGWIVPVGGSTPDRLKLDRLKVEGATPDRLSRIFGGRRTRGGRGIFGIRGGGTCRCDDHARLTNDEHGGDTGEEPLLITSPQPSPPSGQGPSPCGWTSGRCGCQPLSSPHHTPCSISHSPSCDQHPARTPSPRACAEHLRHDAPPEGETTL